MRRWRLVGIALLVTLGGCSVLRDAFTAHPDAAARAAGQTLSVERLAELASRAKGMPLEPASVGRLAGVYVDYVLFAMAQAEGQLLEDTATVARTMWPLVSQMKFEHFLELRRGGTRPTGSQIDSVYAAGELRAFQHILLTVQPNATPPMVQQKQSQINAIWRSLVASGGTGFAAVAKRSSEDPVSKALGGWLDVGPRGRFVPQFEDPAWQLAPGAMSGVVRTSFGFHVIRRPPLAEVRDSFAAGAERALVARHDSAYFVDLARSKDVKVTGGAAETVRNAMEDLDAAGRSHKSLARFRGGAFEVRDFVRWLFAIDPRYASAIPQASDSQIGTLVQQLVTRNVALQQAESAKVQLTDSEWTDVRLEYDSSLSFLRSRLGLSPEAMRDSTTTAEGRIRYAMARVNDYFDRVVTRQTQFSPIPPLMAQVLRERSEWSVDASGVRQAAQRAVTLRASADSLAPPAGAAPGGTGTGLRPAPGPPPVPTIPDSVLQKAPARRSVQ